MRKRISLGLLGGLLMLAGAPLAAASDETRLDARNPFVAPSTLPYQ